MAPKRLAYLNVTPEQMAELLNLPADAEVVGVGWEAGKLLIQVRSEAVPPREQPFAKDADADHKAEHVKVERGESGEFVGFEKAEDK